jgi:hypothetical protein
VADEPTVSLAFFDASHYLVQPLDEKDAAIITLPPRRSARDYSVDELPEGWEKVTKDELFERYAVWQRIEDQLLKQLRDTGSV